MNPQSVPDQGRIGGIVQTSGPRISEVAPPSRITVIEHVVYNTKTDQPHMTVGKFSRDQQTDEQVFKRIVTIGEEWTKLEPNWITTCGMVIIGNEEGKYRQRILSTEEKKEVNSRVLEVYFGTPGAVPVTEHTEGHKPTDQWDERILPRSTDVTVTLLPWAMLLLPPGETQRYTPADVGNIWLRCRNGRAKITITLIPG